MMDKEKLNQVLSSEYSSIVEKLDRLRKALVDQLYILFEKNDIQLGFPIQHRTKSINSILDKVSSGRYTPKKSVQEVQDLVGLRIILLFKRDIDTLSSILEKTLTVRKKYDTSERLKDDQFGYSSLHYVVEIPNGWLTVPTFAGLGNIQIEVQVRTLSQHSWAEASKILQYKREGSVPKQLLRSIGRVSALLETVDLEFERLLVEREVYNSTISMEIVEANDKEEINVDVLRAITVNLLPSKNLMEGEDFESVLYELSVLGIKNTIQLKNLIDKHLNDVLVEEREILKLADGVEDKSELLHEYDEGLYSRGAYFSHEGLVRMALSLEYPEEWAELYKP